jgi:AraC family transcriptional regulator
MKPETQSFYARAVERAVEQVVDGLDHALDLEALARRAALSQFHFHRVFRGMVGETPLELHRRLRMERAAFSLLNEDTSVTQVAFAAGYETHESFSRAFRAYYDLSPTEFRKGRPLSAGSCERPYRVELAARSGIHFEPGPRARFFTFSARREAIMNVDITQMPEFRVATVRHLGPYMRISEAFARLGDAAAGTGLLGPGCKMIAIFHDDPETTPAAELRSDAALSVAPDAVIPAGLGEATIPAGRYARAEHVGPYEGLPDSWARLMGQWLPASDERMKTDGVSYEIYRNTPQDAKPEELVTELYLPLE